MKTAISIPDSIFQSAEALASRLGLSRSELYSRAVSEYIKNNSNHCVTEALNAVYTVENSGLDDGLHTIQVNSVDQEDWS